VACWPLILKRSQNFVGSGAFRRQSDTTDLKRSQTGELPNIAVNDDLRTSAAIVVPASAVPNFETQIALLHTVPGIGLAVVRFSGSVDLHLLNK
jgi:hypothetical protein